MSILSVYLPVFCLSVYLYVRLYTPVCVILYLCICMSVCVSTCLHVHFCLYIYGLSKIIKCLFPEHVLVKSCMHAFIGIQALTLLHTFRIKHLLWRYIITTVHPQSRFDSSCYIGHVHYNFIYTYRYILSRHIIKHNRYTMLYTMLTALLSEQLNSLG
jgi:hypothetical protein